MKRYQLLFLAWTALLLFTACKDEYSEGGFLTLSADRCVFDTAAGSQRLQVAASGAFEVTAPQAAWCRVSAAGMQITVSVDANTTPKSRTTRFGITASYASETIEVTVTQAPADRAVMVLSETDESHTFDAPGGDYRIAVTTASVWNAGIDSDHYTLTTDRETSTLTLSAPVNETDEAHPATLTVTAGEGALSVSRQIAVTQLTKSQSPYYRFIGAWDMYCSRWRWNGETITDGRSLTSCTIVEQVPGESYLIQGLFYASETVNTQIPANFDSETGRMEITVGNEVGIAYYGLYPFYLMMCREEPSSLLYDQLLRCTVSDDGQTIAIDGFLDGYGWGCFPYASGSGYMMLDAMVPYAFADDCYFRRKAATDAISPSSDSRIRRTRTAAQRPSDTATFKTASL